MNLHDCTLLNVLFEWKTGTVTLSFKGPQKTATIMAEGVSGLEVPRRLEWGRSVSVNRVRGPLEDDGKRWRVEIEMQSGNVITVYAGSFAFPQAKETTAVEAVAMGAVP